MRKPGDWSRRDFIRASVAVTGATLLSSNAMWAANPATSEIKPTATDQVELGKTGLKLSRLGIGTGSSNGWQQIADGKNKFVDLIHYAYDQGITYIDTAEAYATFSMIADATKGLPREKLFIQSKIDGQPEDVLKVIDHHRSTFNTDYVDSMLIHCMVRPGWAEQWKRVMDGFNAAKEKKWIRAKGVSCHSLPALEDAAASDFNEVHLVRINPQGKFMDGKSAEWNDRAVSPVDPVLSQIKLMHDKGRGVIGMKIFGNGTFTDVADREKSARFALSNPNIDAIVVGMKTRQELDENLKLINRVLST